MTTLKKIQIRLRYIESVFSTCEVVALLDAVQRYRVSFSSSCLLGLV